MPHEEKERIRFHEMDTEEVLERLETSRDGLSSPEAAKRLSRDGLNEIPSVKRNFLVRMAPQIFDFVIVLLLVIALVLALLAWLFPGKEGTSFETSIAIVSVIIISWGLIIFQMYSAERSLDALREAASAKARVRRGGRWTEIPAKEVVIGDMIMLVEGDRVPADSRIIKSVNLAVDESSLTGESDSVEKESRPIHPKDPPLHEIKNMAFMSTLVVRGSGQAVVTAVGKGNELGGIAKGIQTASDPEIPLQKKMSQLARTLSVILLGLIFTLTMIQILRLYIRGEMNGDSLIDQLVNSVILSVVAVPWSFPIITTSVMARGMLHLIKENAIVRRVASIEGLGRVSVICSDKTGTLTKNEMTVRSVYLDGEIMKVTGSGYGPEGDLFSRGKKITLRGRDHLKRMITAGYLNNNSKVVGDRDGWSVIGDPTEGALKTLGEKAGLEEETKNKVPVREISFSSERKMMTSIFEEEDKYTIYTKGGFEIVSKRCKYIFQGGKIVRLSKERKEIIAEANRRANLQAERTLAIAFRELDRGSVDVGRMRDEDIEKDLVLMGFVGMIDPPKVGVKEAVRKCQDAGIRVVMITGDSRATATAIGRDLGILNSTDLVVEGMDLPLRKGMLRRVGIFCRVSPSDKVDIVNAYRRDGDIIAMTGDGMNDAPALKHADVGVAMGRRGVDVAKEASQIILSDDNFATLVTAIHRGRQIFDNIRKSITYQIYTNLSEVAIMFLGSLIFLEQMMVETHLLFLYFSTHIFPVAALVLDRTTPSVMKEPPRDVKEGIVSPKVLGNLGVMIVTMALISLLNYHMITTGMIDVGIEGNMLLTVQTMTLTMVVWAECINMFNSLSMKDSLLKQIKERNMVLPLAMALIPVTALTVLMYTGDVGERLDLVALTPLQYSISLIWGLTIIPVVELFKVYIRRSTKKRNIQPDVPRAIN